MAGETEPFVAPRHADAAPRHADAGRGALFRAYLGSRMAVYTMAFGGSAGFVFGAWKQSPAIMAAVPAGVVLLVAVISLVSADRAAADRFYSHLAASLGLLCRRRGRLTPFTPLLGAGERSRCEHWMHGRLPGEPALAGGLGHFVWEERRRDGDEVTVQRNRFTVCLADLEASLPLFHGVFLRPKRGLFPPHADWLSRTRKRAIEMESAAFTERYDLFIADDEDEGMARRLLAPSLVSWLAGHPLTPGFELRAGTLVVYVERPLEDAGNLVFLLDAARRIAGRILEEVEEHRLRAA
jgi:hypothetical protein